MQRPAAAGGRRRGDPYPAGVNPPGTGADALGTAAEAGPWPGHPQPAMPISRNSGCRLARSGALRNRRQRAAAAEAPAAKGIGIVVGHAGRAKQPAVRIDRRSGWRSRLARRHEGVGGGRESCFFPAVRLLSWEGAGRLLVGWAGVGRLGYAVAYPGHPLGPPVAAPSPKVPRRNYFVSTARRNLI